MDPRQGRTRSRRTFLLVALSSLSFAVCFLMSFEMGRPGGREVQERAVYRHEPIALHAINETLSVPTGIYIQSITRVSAVPAGAPETDAQAGFMSPHFDGPPPPLFHLWDDDW